MSGRRASSVSPCGGRNSRTRIVIMMAITPSVNASSRPLVMDLAGAIARRTEHAGPSQDAGASDPAATPPSGQGFYGPRRIDQFLGYLAMVGRRPLGAQVARPAKPALTQPPKRTLRWIEFEVLIACQPSPSTLDRDAVKSVSAEARGDAALTRATRTPRGSLREAVQLLAKAVGILWLNDRGKPEPPEVLPYHRPASLRAEIPLPGKYR